LVASAPYCDVQLDYCLRVNPWRAQPDSSHGHVARDYQRDRLRCYLGLVFLYRTSVASYFRELRDRHDL
jgi:hypothetical protein